MELWPSPNEIESNYVECKVEVDEEQETIEVNYVDVKVEEGFSFEFEDKRPSWIKEKVEDFQFDTRKDKISEIKIDFRVENDKQSEFEEERMMIEN